MMEEKVNQSAHIYIQSVWGERKYMCLVLSSLADNWHMKS